MIRRPSSSTLFPYTTLFRSESSSPGAWASRSTSPTCAAVAPVPRDHRSLPDGDLTNARSHHRSHRLRRRSEEHTSELQSQSNLVCRLLLEKKNFTVMHDRNR